VHEIDYHRFQVGCDWLSVWFERTRVEGEMGDRYQQGLSIDCSCGYYLKPRSGRASRAIAPTCRCGEGPATGSPSELDNWGSRELANGNDPQVTARESSAIVEWSGTAKMPTRYGTFSVRAFRDREHREHAVLFQGDMAGRSLVPVRVHSECLTSEVLGSLRCDCKTQLDMALAHIAERGVGMLIYLRQEGRGTGLVSKIDAYALQDNGLDTVEASGALGVPVDARTYELAGEVIRLFDIASISLLTNNPEKIESLRRQGVEVAHRTPMLCEPNEFNDAYLRTKKAKMSHLF